MIKAEYTTLIVNNLAESVTFYRDVLGFREGYHIDLPNGAAITIMQSEGASVELIEGKMFPTGFYSIGTDVTDLDATLEKMKLQGCNPISPIVPTSVGRQVFIQDPNGVRICLIEHTDAYRDKYMK